MKCRLLLLSLICAILPALAQPLPSARKRAVYGKGFYVAPSQYDYSEVAREIAEGASSKYEQARAIYLWTCEHISYDTQTDIRTADLCWDSKRAVCQGYCELFYRMADCLSLKTTLIYGLCRLADGKEEEHAWLSVETERGEILMDPTWGAGAVINGEFRRQMMPLLWFDVEPEWLIFTHFPHQKRHQHLKVKVTAEEYALLDYASPLMAKLGIHPSQLLLDMKQGISPLPHIPTLSAPFIDQISIKEAPITRSLKTGTPITFTVQKHTDCLLSLKNGKQRWDDHAWQKDGDTYSITITPQSASNLYLNISSTGYLHLSTPILIYEVVNE